MITFDGQAAPGLYTYFTSYTESGYTLTGTYNDVLISGDGTLGIVGDSTGAVAFNNFPGLTLAGSGPFDLDTIDVGGWTQAPGGDITITGNIDGGGTDSVTYTGLTTAVTETLNWTNLDSVQFSTSSYAGFDNVVIDASSASSPEPGTLVLLGAGVGGLALARRRQNA